MALGTRNPSIGIVPDREVAAARVNVPPGSALHLFSDGVFEIVDQHEQQWSIEHVLALLPDASGPGGPRRLYEQVRAAARPGRWKTTSLPCCYAFPEPRDEPR